jgi:hypothetical protein
MSLPKRSGIPIEMTLAAIDEEGKVLREQYVHSFHRAFVWMLGQHLNNLSVSGMVDTGGTLRSAKGAHTTTHLGFRAANTAAGNLTYGIICGLSNQAIDKTDYAMVNPIAEGTGVDQLNYGAMPQITPVDTVDGAVADLTRTVTNNSASAIDIEEVGFYFYNYDLGATIRYYMGDRTLFQKTIDPAEAVTFRYRIQTV